MTTVELSFKEKVLEDYLRWIMKSPKGEINIKTKFALGKFIISQVKPASVPRKSFSYGDVATIRIPLANLKKEQQFLYFNEFSTEQINKALAFYFDLDFRQFCVSGREKGIKTHIIIKSFMRMHNITNTDDLFERLKKRDYRRRELLDNYLASGVKLIESELYIV